MPNSLTMFGSTIMLFVCPTSSCRTVRSHHIDGPQLLHPPSQSIVKAHEHRGGSFQSCQMPDADFKIAFGFVLCQEFLTPPASEVLAVLIPLSLPWSTRRVCVCPGTDSWERAALALHRGWSTGRRDMNFLMLTCWCLSALTAGGLF